MDKKTTEEKLKKLAKEAVEVAKPYVEKAEPVIKDVKEVAKPYIDKAEPVIKKVKDKATPAAEVVKKRSKKATEVAKNAARDLSVIAAKHTCKEEVFVQYNSHEYRTTDIVAKAKEDYIRKGHDATEIKEIQVYIKPADGAAYYVVNHSETGKVES
jgi:hypothetical protein